MKPTETGRIGEDAVCRKLEAEGCRILETNFRIRGGEIDIIAVKDDELRFVEVKTRAPDALDSGFAAVDGRKQRLLIRAVHAYFEKSGLHPEDWYIRYDIAAVTMRHDRILNITYLENAFDESGLY